MTRTESYALTPPSPAVSPSEPCLSDLAVAPKLERKPEILSISPIREDHEVLRSILKDFCEIHSARTRREAVDFLCWDRVAGIFCEKDLPDGSWMDILSYTADLTSPPALIVTSRLADEHLWAEVLNMGGYDVLAKPFREREVTWALREVFRPTRRILTAGASGF